ncbi:MAG: hypothetical protein Q4B50_03715 [Bacillota bacterium]|nr:hypothetical protein [Bacillota bacterium]
MFMQKIRRSTKKNRTILLIVVALLAIGIVGSFAVWNSNDYGMPADAEMTAAEMVEQYEQYLAENTPENIDEIDYNTASSTAQNYMTLSQYAGMAASEASGTDADLTASYMLMQMDAATDAVEYYKKAIELAPESLNAEGEAALLSDLAYAQYYATNYDDARVNFDKAYATSATYGVVQDYTQFLFSVDGIEAVEEVMEDYMGRFTDQSSTEYTNAKSLLEYYQALDQIYNAPVEEEGSDDSGMIAIDEEAFEEAKEGQETDESVEEEDQPEEAEGTEEEVVNE